MTENPRVAHLSRAFHDFKASYIGSHFEAYLSTVGFKRELARVERLLENVANREAEDGETSGVLPAKAAIAYMAELEKTGARVRCGVGGTQGEGLLTAAEFHLNRFFGWILVGVFESWERFIKDVTAALGYAQRDSWNCQMYGNITLGEIDGLDFEWFAQRVRQQGMSIDPMLNRLRDAVIPDLQTLEAREVRGMPCIWGVRIVEYLRHVLVHAGGTLDPDAMIEKVMRRLGLAGEANREQLRVAILGFIKGGGLEDGAVVQLVPRNVGADTPAPAIESRLLRLLEYLGSHARLIWVLSHRKVAGGDPSDTVSVFT